MPPISRPGSSHYWVTPSYRKRRLSELPVSTNHHTDNEILSSSDISSRNYIDPWDLENYAYMERHYTTDEYVTPTPALESSQSDFYYVPNYQEDEYTPRHKTASTVMADESIGLFAGIEEEDFYNERYKSYNNKSPSPLNNNCYQSYTDLAATRYKVPNFGHKQTRANSYEDDTTSYSGGEYSHHAEYVNPRLNYELYSPSVMLRRPPNHRAASDAASLVYVYEAGSRKRKMALPKGNFGFEGRSELRGSYRSLQRGQLSDDCYPTDMSDDLVSLVDDSTTANYDEPDVEHHRYDEEEEIYSSRPVPKYQLSKYGHLKIDYSFSWNSLDRYIGTDEY